MNLEIHNLTIKYGKFSALSNISVTLRSGGLTGLIGANGAGKSTLIKALSTLLRPTGGQILLDGVDICRKPNAMRNVLGYLPQDVPVYPNLDAWEYLAFLASIKGLNEKEARHQIKSLMKALHLSDVGKKHLSQFSGGMRQRVGIAGALLGDPKIIIFDEPTTGLDPTERVAVRNLLTRLAANRIVLLSTHIVSDVEAAASSLILLKSGKMLYHGTPESLAEHAEGHVWQCSVPSLSMIPGEITVSSTVQERSGIHVKIVGKQPTFANSSPAAPTLEDACLYAMRGESV
jgi:ABC-type multidrug transport system ATPase subunit